MPELSVIVFAYNEEANVTPVLRELRDWLQQNEPRSEIIFVDDGSTDDTAETAAQALAGFPHQITKHASNRGIGAAIKTGVAHAQGEYITFLPADGQIPPSAVGTLRAVAQRDGAEVVLSVYDRRDDGWHRKVLSWGVRVLILLLHGVKLRSEGAYLFKKSLFHSDQLPSDSFFLNFEFPIAMLRDKRRVSVTIISCRPRLSGQSKSANWRHIWFVARDLVALRLRRMRARSR